MTFGSLFAGIGGFDLGLERAGMTPVFQVEIDPFCRRVLAKHWPDVRRYEDVRTVHGRGACPDGLCDRCLPDVDLLCGGFPCQDISNAGHRKGIDGERSGLWSEFARLIGEIRPGYVFVENVSALLSRGLGRVLGDLAAGGYDSEWDCLPASAVGAPHRRDRLWLVAYADSARRRKQQKRELWRIRSSDAGDNGTQGTVAHSYSIREGCYPETFHAGQFESCGSGALAYATRGRLEGRIFTHSMRGQANSDWRGELARVGSAINPWAVEPNVGRVAHGIPARVDRLRGLGNAVVPQIVEWIGRRILESERAA